MDKSPSNSPPSQVPSNSLSSTPVVPPTKPPSNVKPQILTVADRQTLQLALPSTRILSEILQQTSGASMDNASYSLLRKHSDIISIREQRERAWHENLMTCSSTISCIENTLAGFQDKIEKEEVCVFREYIRKAISKFAAPDSAPSPPLISSNPHQPKMVQRIIWNSLTN